MYLNIKTGYSFRKVFGTVENTINHVIKNKCPFAGIADINNTFGHSEWQKVCLDSNIKPIFGVVVYVYEHSKTGKEYRRIKNNETTIIALNQNGLQEIYRLLDLAYQQFYYIPRVTINQVNSLSDSVIILSGHAPFGITHKNLFQTIAPNIFFKSTNKKEVACIDNSYITHNDKADYESFADSLLLERKTTNQTILNHRSWLKICSNKKALKNMIKIADSIDFTIEKAKMVKIETKQNIFSLCKIGAKKRGINIKKGAYKKRLKRELELIKCKGYEDYFLIVWDLVKYAKKYMLVGTARGSAAGSLVCYLLEITEVNPLKYGLLFERFLDVNRHDLPDIDIDFQDNKRHMILSYLKKKYDSENVSQIANISQLKIKSAVQRISKNTNNYYDENSDELNVFLNHPLHSSIHAAGIIVSNKPITNFCGINSRDKQRIAMVDKKGAENLNLLKIDALGLRTLSIIADILDLIGKNQEWLYSLKLNNKKAFKLLNKKRFQGIFQFEGEAIQTLAEKIKLENIEDLSILSAICRPGALASGGANRYIKRRNDSSQIKLLDSSSKSFEKITRSTFGIIVFQEQVMKIAREYAGLSWAKVSELRKAVSKSKGLKQFEKLFIKSAIKNGRKRKNAQLIWNDIETHGGYSFNVSHSISYAIITYFTAFFKANYPLEFCCATLNHTKDDFSGLKILRDCVENDGLKYKFFDKKISEKEWIIHKNKLIGGLLTIDGIGIVSANKYLNTRNDSTLIPYNLNKKIKNADSVYKYLYPAKQLYGEYKATPIKKIKKNKEYTFVGRLVEITLRNLNEPKLLNKRGYKIENRTEFLQLKIEDDTGIISCVIWNDEYQDFGKNVKKTANKKDWFLLIGEKENSEYNSIKILNMVKITK